jgi:hypothetical protein
MMATTEFVVPRSIPMIFFAISVCLPSSSRLPAGVCRGAALQ